MAFGDVRAALWESGWGNDEEFEVYLRFAAAVADDAHIERCLELCEADCSGSVFCLFSQVCLMAKLCELESCPRETIGNHFAGIGRDLVMSACADELMWPDDTQTFVFSIGCHLLSSVLGAVELELDDDLIGAIAAHSMDCVGPHAGLLISPAIRSGRVPVSLEQLDNLLPEVNDDEFDDFELDAVALFEAVFHCVREEDIDVCSRYVGGLWAFLRKAQRTSAWMAELGMIMFELFDGNWGIHRELRLQILESVFGERMGLPGEDHDIVPEECAVLTTFLCRLALSVGDFGEATETVVSGFGYLAGQARDKLFRNTVDESNGRSCYSWLLPCEIELTLFLCGCHEIDPGILFQMRNEGMIPSNYHRRLVLCAIDRMQQIGRGCQELDELAGILMREKLVGPAIMEENDDACDTGTFDRWDSSLWRFDAFVV
jgi:hypothetical protein